MPDNPASERAETESREERKDALPRMVEDMLPSRSLTLRVSTSDLRRVRAYMERFNARNPAEDSYELDDYHDYTVAVHALLYMKLAEDERKHGLQATIDGFLVPIRQEDDDA